MTLFFCDRIIRLETQLFLNFVVRLLFFVTVLESCCKFWTEIYYFQWNCSNVCLTPIFVALVPSKCFSAAHINSYSKFFSL